MIAAYFFGATLSTLYSCCSKPFKTSFADPFEIISVVKQTFSKSETRACSTSIIVPIAKCKIPFAANLVPCYDWCLVIVLGQLFEIRPEVPCNSFAYSITACICSKMRHRTRLHGQCPWRREFYGGICQRTAWVATSSGACVRFRRIKQIIVF